MLVFMWQHFMDSDLKLHLPFRKPSSALIVTTGSKSKCWVELNSKSQSGTVADTSVVPSPTLPVSISPLPTEGNSIQPTLSQLHLAPSQGEVPWALLRGSGRQGFWWHGGLRSRTNPEVRWVCYLIMPWGNLEPIETEAKTICPNLPFCLQMILGHSCTHFWKPW